jgi:hypothetical protein
MEMSGNMATLRTVNEPALLANMATLRAVNEPAFLESV